MKTQLIEKIEILNRRVWDNRLNKPQIEAWLNNFKGLFADVEAEQLHALYLLSQFMYFGHQQVRQIVKAMFRDLYQYPVIEQIRRQNNDTRDLSLIKIKFNEHLKSTRFLGLGNPSESGCHILYYFRQMNGLPKDIFVQSHELLSSHDDPAQTPLHFVFIDDFCGSGETALKASDLIKLLRKNHPRSKIDHFTLFACEAGLENVRLKSIFDKAEAVIELDNSFRCFDSNSRYFSPTTQPADLSTAEATCTGYGNLLAGAGKLGFGDCQLLLAFHHNTPDNTLPIFWSGPSALCAWTALFPRYPKLSFL